MGDFQIGRLQAALANATNEVTVAAANINFDFCLVKYDAPKEYHPIGALLSMRRKEDAESGKSHVTARRLAALFQNICPDTPNLIAAYGQRVSEISKAATNDGQASHFANSMFSQFAGIDATSIWAAATSSDTAAGGALHVHLLASMLAKMWTPPEAVSIWDELVKERRRVVADQLERGESLPFSLATAAAQQDIPRAQLAEWDASARAWLQTADSHMTKQQTQLRLILRNIEMPVDRTATLYSSVLEAWVTALTVMERLVSGIPQEVQNGAALLGLAAWHLYPDMHVFGMRNTEVKMQDSLVKPGGVLTLGCSQGSPTASTAGITWSLSLSHLKFYGRPVERGGFIHSDPTHLSFRELVQVTLGCVATRWRISIAQMPVFAAVLSAMARTDLQYRSDEVNYYKIKPDLAAGLGLLAEAAEAYNRDPEVMAPLFNLGVNRPKFIPPGSDLKSGAFEPFPGLLHPSEFINLLKGPNARVLFLRRIACRHLDAKQPEFADCIIRYDTPEGGKSAWASVLPAKALRRGTRSTQNEPQDHLRWDDPEPTKLPSEHHYMTAADARARFLEDGPFVVRTEGKKRVRLVAWFGSPQAFIFVKHFPARPALSVPNIDLEDLLWALEAGHLPEMRMRWGPGVCTAGLLAAAHQVVFKHVSTSSPLIQLQTLLRPLVAAKWANDLGAFETKKPDRGYMESPGLRLATSIISYFISDCDIYPVDIPLNVCGVSMGDSLYIPAKLTNDPFDEQASDAFVRVLGNIGRPGFVMFSSVCGPVMSNPSETSWRVLNKKGFDGRPENTFRTTSMHLSFTDWERPISEPGADGIKDAQLLRMESFISIRDAGRWVGDVDILTALRDERVCRLPPQNACTHGKIERLENVLVSVESWDELRDSHSGNVVVRAFGNWVARLAVAAFLSQGVLRGDFQIQHIIICPDQVCWKCTESFQACVFIY
ncbi:hypothetical protein B0T14DRAFT_523374 [Immersiella caudata]|uniref:Uncharacterized protein n=1 Tax=Immersiella caudata TaxID=314043 RepID=A0AA39WJG9_9PEZI|nr:hypothetical protein B0T14DRAFT_523374 [Immersiella caudata]